MSSNWKREIQGIEILYYMKGFLRLNNLSFAISGY